MQVLGATRSLSYGHYLSALTHGCNL